MSSCGRKYACYITNCDNSILFPNSLQLVSGNNTYISYGNGTIMVNANCCGGGNTIDGNISDLTNVGSGESLVVNSVGPDLKIKAIKSNSSLISVNSDSSNNVTIGVSANLINACLLTSCNVTNIFPNSHQIINGVNTTVVYNPNKTFQIDSTAGLTFLNNAGITTQTDVGKYSSMVIDSQQNLHIAYYDVTNKKLKYAKRISGVWELETILTNADDYGKFCSIDVDTNDTPYICYLEIRNNATNKRRVRLIKRINTGNWTVPKTVSASPYKLSNNGINNQGASSIAIAKSGVFKNSVNIVYYNNDGTVNSGEMIYYRELSNGNTILSSIDISLNITSDGLSSLKIDNFNNYPHVVYQKNTNLKYTYYNSSSWIVALTIGSVNANTYHSFFISSNVGHVSYYSNLGDLRYIRTDNISVTYPTAPSWASDHIVDSGVGSYNSIYANSTGFPRVSYYGSQNLLLAYSSIAAPTLTADWNVLTVDGSVDVGTYSSLVINSNNVSDMAYYNMTNGSLKHANVDGTFASPYTEFLDGVDIISANIVNDDTGPILAVKGIAAGSSGLLTVDGSNANVVTIDASQFLIDSLEQLAPVKAKPIYISSYIGQDVANIATSLNWNSYKNRFVITFPSVSELEDQNLSLNAITFTGIRGAGSSESLNISVGYSSGGIGLGATPESNVCVFQLTNSTVFEAQKNTFIANTIQWPPIVADPAAPGVMVIDAVLSANTTTSSSRVESILFELIPT